MSRKYIFVTGGVLSGVGKGITAASIGAILQDKGLSVSVQKCDPYLNIDAGLLNPAEHGECFVTGDGAETDLDLGHYERFLDVELTRNASTLSGKLLLEVIQDERAGKYDGKTVQFVPHLTNKIQDSILKSGEGSDIHIVEIGGTVGDYEGLSFIEAIREFSRRVGDENCLYVHVVYAPYLSASGEFKTKPAQNALRDLRSFGIVPDCVVVRTDKDAPKSISDKIALYGGVNPDNVIIQPNVDSVYSIPLIIAQSNIMKLIDKFTGSHSVPKMDKWKRLMDDQAQSKGGAVKVGIVAKYLDNDDTYISIVQALQSSGWSRRIGVDIKWIDAEKVSREDLDAVDALVVPGGFGPRGVEGKIDAALYALDSKKPYLGICLGFQVMAIAAARRSGLSDANSTEFNPDTSSPVVHMLDGDANFNERGLRLGNYEASLAEGSLVADLYQGDTAVERHRNKYEINQDLLDSYAGGGVKVAGRSVDGRYVEYIEGVDHPFLVGAQSHPEYNSRPYRSHPLFDGLIDAAMAAVDK